MVLKRQRLYLLDALRAVSILLMIGYHLAYDIADFGIVPLPIGSPPYEAWRLVIVIGFCTISGISQNLSRSRLRRAFIVIAVAYGVTLATYLYNPRFFVVFGILHCLGFCALIYALCKSFVDNLFGKLTPFVWLLLFVILSFVKFPIVDVPHLYMFGFCDAAFSSSDYYPLIPWLFLFLFGASISHYITEGKLPAKLYQIRIKPLEFLGRHSLLIYVLHQPIIIGIISLITFHG